ncbi:MAG: hypothetical protein IJW64_00880, partial [Clostridia bacterium]|nr:hypothetical protein [Clostridia bacterium]
VIVDADNGSGDHGSGENSTGDNGSGDNGSGGNGIDRKDDEDGLSTAAVVATIVGLSVAVLGGGGFAIYWFVFKKRKS